MNAYRIADLLAASDPSTRLRAALAAGTEPDLTTVDALVDRCRTEPDFFVRDMLTWALTRLPAEVVVPRLIDELHSGHAQARSQALHTLSKIGDPAAWPALTPALLHDDDPEVARAAWRAAVVLVPADDTNDLVSELASELGRGDTDLQRSLSRALASLTDANDPVWREAASHPAVAVRAHATATLRLIDDPDSDFDAALTSAIRASIGTPPAPRHLSC